MDVIIMGLGAVGKVLTAEMSKKGLNVVVIDKDENKVEDAVSRFDVKGVVGNGVSQDVLEEAGISRTEIFIAATSQDELNILSGIIAGKLGADTTIARVSEPEYFHLFSNADSLGVSLMVNPHHEAAMEISRILRFPSAIKVDQFSEGKTELVEFKVENNSPLVGLMLKDFTAKFTSKVLVCAATRDNKAIIPTGDFIINPNDHLFITATKKHITEFFKELGWNKQAKDVMIVGGSKTAVYLATELEKKGIRAKIIEKNLAKCEKLAETLSKTEIIHGDGTNQELLRDEGILDADAFVALVDIDEQNIIMSMFAKSVGVPKVVTKIDQLDYYTMLQNSGIDSVVSTKTSTADLILRFVRNYGHKEGATVKRLFRIVDEQAEALEFDATKSFRKLGVPIMDLHLKKNLLIAGIIRDNILIIPTGKDFICEGDSVIVVTLNKDLVRLNDILDTF